MHFKKIKSAILITAVLVTTCFNSGMVYAEETAGDQQAESSVDDSAGSGNTDSAGDQDLGRADDSIEDTSGSELDDEEQEEIESSEEGMLPDQGGEDAPCDMKINLLSEPYGVSKSQLSFSWVDASVNGMQEQSAYRIVLSKREQDAAEGAYIYDTDWVESSQNTSVLYDLSAVLEDNELYYWQVQIKNEEGMESSLSEAQPFTTAVGSAWAGKNTIWGADGQKTVILRSEISRPENVERAVMSITAVSSSQTRQYIYNLYVNGVEIGAGPTRQNDKVLYYNTYDLTDVLQEGSNAVGLINYAENNAGVLCQITYYFADGTSQVVNNSSRDSATWKVYNADNVYIGSDTASIGTVYYTAKKDNINMNYYPEGWMNAGYSVKSWNAVKNQNRLSNLSLEPSQMDNMKRYEVQPASVTAVGNGTYLVDMGKEIVGSLKLALNAGKGMITLEYGEELQQDGSVKYKMNTGNQYQEKWTLRAGTQSASGIGMKTFRYVMIRGCSASLGVDNVRGLELRQAFDDDASSFSSSNSTLNDVYEFSKHTSKVTNQDLYVDTQNRERGAYEGDALITAMTSYSYSASSTLAGYSAKYLLTHTTWPAEYSLYNIMMVYENYMYTGDKRELESNYQLLKQKTLEQYYDPSVGLMKKVSGSNVKDQQIMVDWPASERDGYEISKSYYNTVFNAVCVGGYEDMAKIALALGYAGEAEHYQGLADTIRANMIQKLYHAETGEFYDGLDSQGNVVEHSAQHATAYALAFGIYTDQNMADVMVQSIEDDEEIRMSIYSSYFLLQGLYRSNHGDLARKIMSNSESTLGVRSWGCLIYGLGATTTTEAWNSKSKSNMSMCHVWGSAPGSMLVRGMFGIQPTSPGFDTFQMKLQPGGVKDGNVKVPTLKGSIEATYALNGDGGISGTVTVPSNSECELMIPADNADGGIILDGEVVTTVYSDGYLTCTAVAGTHTFAATGTKASIDNSEWTKTDVVYSTYAKSAWSESVTSGLEAGKLSDKIESLRMELRNQKVSGSIEYSSYVQGTGWLDWTESGNDSGTPGSGKRVEAYKIRLTGELAKQYDVYYRAYAQSTGWLDWAENGEAAGTSGYAKELYRIQVILVRRGSAAPGNTTQPYKSKDKQISYATHVQSYGWQAACGGGEISGTVGSAKRLEAIKISLGNTGYSGSISYCTHVQSYGWQDWKSDGQVSGTSGQAKRLEAIKIKLTGDIAEEYDVYYRVHVQSFGWLDWAKNGEASGSEGYGKRLEAIQIKLDRKGNVAPGDVKDTFRKAKISYRTHVQSYGWQDYKYDGEMSGTSGRSKRLEAIQIKNLISDAAGDIEYRTQIQTYGWETKWVKNGGMSGTSGRSKRLEAIQIRLTDELEEQYDIYYRVHAQTYGWLGWAKNGESAGTEGLSKRLEGIEIVLVEKCGKAPGSTENAFVKK